MNRIIFRSFTPSLAFKVQRIGVMPKRIYSSIEADDPTANSANRLRTEEDAYCNKVSTPFKQPYQGVIDAINKETRSDFDNSHMMVGKVQGKFLAQLVSILRPNKVLEIGGYTGSSSVAMGSALLKDASLLSLELDPKHIAIAARHVESANLQDKVKFKEGPAGESLLELAKQSPKIKYDFIFLDADKGGYTNYYDTIMDHDLLTDRGVIVVDNVLFYGQVHKQAAKQDDPEATKNVKKQANKLVAFNEHVFKDPRVEVVVLPVFDGVSLIRKVTNK